MARPIRQRQRSAMTPAWALWLFGIRLPGLERENAFLFLELKHGLAVCPGNLAREEPPKNLRIEGRSDATFRTTNQYARRIWEEYGGLLKHPKKHPAYERFGPPGVSVGKG